jgi:two-component system OmpR family sensor kinase
MMRKRSLFWRKVYPWLLAILPALAGGLAWMLMGVWGRVPDPVVYLRFSLSVVLLVLGGLLSLAALASLAGVRWMQRGERQRLSQAQSATAAAHRRFLQRLDHELKNPLTALQVELANLEDLLSLPQSTGEPADSQDIDGRYPLQRFKGHIRRLVDLSTGLRKLAELEALPIEREPVEMDHLLREIVDEITAAGYERQFNLDLPATPWRLPPVSGDADLLELALRNVLENSFKFTRSGDSIQVRAFEDGNWVIVEFTDSGPGIPDDEQAQVWDELFRGKNARGTPGSGLGLALVRTVIDRHGGQATLRSQVGRGTRITLRLPARV